MEFISKNVDIFVPDGATAEAALERTTHMAVSAHQDDIEIMAYDGILKCFGKSDSWFTGVVVTNGSGSPRDDIYSGYTDEDMQKIRALEQKKAAFVGEYSAQVLLNYPSSVIKDSRCPDSVSDLKTLFLKARPKYVYIHNPADKHDTHVATLLRTISALRDIKNEFIPEKVYGCEVWRDLDWVCDNSKQFFDVGMHENIAAALMGVFDSQICGGKRYDLAIMGRRRAYATFTDTHATDSSEALSLAIDMTGFIYDVSMTIQDFVDSLINDFRTDIRSRLDRFK